MPELFGDEVPSALKVSWGLSEVLCYLRHLELRGEVQEQAGDPALWSVAA